MDSSNSIQVLFQKAHVEAVIANERQVTKWETYRRDVAEVGDRLKVFLRDLNVPVMVPVGNKALFRGKLVHTNDVMISLGDGYFTKGSVEQALEVVARRLTKCDQMLEKLAKERSLLESRSYLEDEEDIFPSEDNNEIVAEYDEAEEEEWRVEHRKKVRDYKQKLAKMKEEEPVEIHSDEDLWKRLEILEMEEELNDELDRLGTDDDSESSSENSYEESSDENTGENSKSAVNINAEYPGSNKVPLTSIMKQTRNSPSKDQHSLINDSDDHIKINFKHSSHEPELNEYRDTINSPHDIYLKFSDALDKKSKKAVRRVSFADSPEIKIFKKEFNEEPVYFGYPKYNREREDLPVAFGDVVERTEFTECKVNESRPLSKFKSSRIKQKSK